MSQSYIFTKKSINSLLRESSEEDLLCRLAKKETPLPARVPGAASVSPQAIAKRLKLTQLSQMEQERLFDPQTAELKEEYQKNIENFIGTVKVPIGLASLYLACGQDVACVAESAIGVTRIELTPNDELYASVTLPNIMVGTVGGGTKLPSQQSCLKIMGLAGAQKARSFAEVCAALALAGELSIQGAICAHHFSRAHHRLAREKKA